jgi:peptidoglycan/xylan/chitin deacetylase (PgdA/CDA1 family)
VDEGHAVGNHTYTHTEPSETGAAEFGRELDRTSELIEGLAGVTPTLVRPPKGKLTLLKLAAAWMRGQTVVLWNRDPKDYACRSADELSRTLEVEPLRGGDMLLLHDDRPHAAAVLPELIERTRSDGLRFGTPFDWDDSMLPSPDSDADGD